MLTTSTWNRICIVLAFAGLFVAGFLTLSSFGGWEIPCGASQGCDIVEGSRFSHWFGIPVALYGFAAYAILAGLALIRAFSETHRSLATKLGLIISGIGTLVSVFLIYESMTAIQATCLWCMTSAAIMALLLISHAFMSQAEPGEFNTGVDLKLVCVLLPLVIVGYGLRAADLKKAAHVTLNNKALPQTIDDMIPPKANVFGPPTAPVIIVEFGDLCCPHCQEAYTQLHKVVDASNGNVRLVFRQFPLTPVHPFALMAATISEMAADQDKFWDFLDVMYASEDVQHVNSNDLMKMAQKIGLSPADVQKRMGDSKDPALARVQADMNEGFKLGIKSTPTFVFGLSGKAPQSGGSSDLRDALLHPPYSQYVKGMQ